MQIWIKKENDMEPQDAWRESYIFSLNRDTYSTIYTNLADAWYHMDQQVIEPLYEDLFVIGLSIFAVDKRVSRRLFTNCWTRNLSVSIPVIEYDKWKLCSESWEKLLNFLTGDDWKISFRKTEKIYSLRKNPNRKHIDVSECNCVSLFSGGLDSFCGAIKLWDEGKTPCFIGHNEYPKLRLKQEGFVEAFQRKYSEHKINFISFSANSRAPKTCEGISLKGTENTSRGRSLLFLCVALSIAGIIGNNVPVYIPENGFIGLNLPLTDSRKGTCSTRTTHPHFLREFNSIIKSVGIQNEIINFFAYSTKREIVDSVKENECFQQFYSDTISCSHPCQARWNKNGNNRYPINCGYCYPCLIRKSSLINCNDNPDTYSFNGDKIEFLNSFSETDKVNDLKAVLTAVYQSKRLADEDLKRKIKYTGRLSKDEVDWFLNVYRKTMADLEEMFIKEDEFAEYLGMEKQ